MNDRKRAAAGNGASRILADGHVHIYPQYDLGCFFRRSLEVARAVDSPLLLLLAESHGHRYFEALSKQARQGLAPAPREDLVRLGPTDEPTSIRVEAADRSGPDVFLIAGRQIVSKEALETLIIGLEPGHILYSTADRQRPMEQLVTLALEAGAITVLPWGFGKWLGSRGRLVRRLCDRQDLYRQPLFFLGDILARCRPWPTPGAFGGQVRVLPGTDILPLQGFESRLAGYGFKLQGRLDERVPCCWLMEMFRQRVPLEPFGSRDSTIRAVINQLHYRVRNTRRRANGSVA